MDLLSAIEFYPVLGFALATLLGLLVGSFLNVVIYRLPKMMEREWRTQCEEFLAQDTDKNPESSFAAAEQKFNLPSQPPFNLIVPRSRCPHCGHQIKAWENIPVVSYFFLKGQCSACKAPISLRYPSIEFITGLLSLVVIYFVGFNWSGLAALMFTWALIALTLIDLDTFLLPDDITLPLLWLGLLVNTQGTFTSLSSAVWGAAVGYLTLWLVYKLFKMLTGKEGMGYGDFKLLAALGAWMGWQMLPQIILLSSFVGALVGISMIVLRGRDKNIPIPFGPYLAVAGWIAFIWGDTINRTYLQLFIQ